MCCDLDKTVLLEISPNRGGNDFKMDDLMQCIDYAIS